MKNIELIYRKFSNGSAGEKKKKKKRGSYRFYNGAVEFIKTKQSKTKLLKGDHSRKCTKRKNHFNKRM